MRKHLLAAALLLAILPLGAQTYDVMDVVSGNRNLLSGCEGPYRFDAPAMTQAPKGYEPVYISHYGRHGSRYAWNSGTYTTIKKVLDAARDAGSFTERGQQLYNDFYDFYQIPLMNSGDLSELGWDQHTQIAATMARDFSDVFEDGGLVVAEASTSQRAIVSMQAFCVSLQKNAPKVEIRGNSLHTNLPVTNVYSSPAEILPRREGSLPTKESLADFRARKVDFDAILDNLFKDKGFLEELGGRSNFVSELFTLWAGYHNYSNGQWLEDIFTEEQLEALWEVDNYSCYLGHSSYRFHNIALLQDIINDADESMAGGVTKAHLRFGHDTVVNAICPLLNLNGCGYMPENADDVKYWFHNYDTPMGANIQFILYKSKKSPDVLFKVLRNGAEATLPQLEAVTGPYYKWSDFKAWADQVAQAHPLVKR